MIMIDESLFGYPILPYVRGADYAPRKPWRLGQRRLLDYLLVYVEQGKCLVHVEGVDYVLEKGDFCLIQPGDLHMFEGVTNTITPYMHLDFFYNPQRAESYQTRPGQIDLRHLAHLQQPRLNDFPGISIPVKPSVSDPVLLQGKLLQLIGVWQGQDRLRQLEVQLLATQILMLLLKEYYSAPPISVPQPHSLNWITSYLSLSIAEPITVSDMARHAHLSPSHFARMFRRQMGMSPHKYLLQMRIAHAQELLATTPYSFEQVSVYCGFANAQHFAKTFRQRVGLTPGEYRQRNQQEPSKLSGEQRVTPLEEFHETSSD